MDLLIKVVPGCSGGEELGEGGVGQAHIWDVDGEETDLN